MENETPTIEGTETPDTTTAAESEAGDPEKVREDGVVDHGEIGGEGVVDHGEIGGDGVVDHAEISGEGVVDHGEIGGEGVVDHGEIGGEGAEEVGGEHMEGEHAEGEEKDKVLGEGEELMGEEMEGEHAEVKETEAEKVKEEEKVEEKVEEEEQYVEPPPPDPTAPFGFTDSSEALKDPFTLRLDQIAEVEQLWEYFQNYTPAYTDIDNYITEKELSYMLKALILMTVTPEQFQEVIAYCARPPHPEGHITFEQFQKIVTIRQRECTAEEELRSALLVFDSGRTGLMDRELLKEVLLKQGYKMPQKQLNNLMKEVDMSNDGTIGVEDVVGTMCMDLNTEDLITLRNKLFPSDEPPPPDED
ncbi:Calmodulin-A [Operophtera brumata]|uniref:Calmodulin-A n=1 Tax=Operophtera brumata TaxID=104452 RepID=A0A0L7KZK8_OPEBR|nr:Calmodulin-A [Operophtera brumata]